MIWKIYLIIVIYFVLGAIGFYFINRKKEPAGVRKSWIKYLTYIGIIHLLFFSIIAGSIAFLILSACIVLMGFYELFKLHYTSGFHRKRFFLSAILLYGLFAYGLLIFSGLNKHLILFSFLIISIFDSFSQITGQLWGGCRIFPKISPQKTAGGLLGGSLAAFLSAFLIKNLLDKPLSNILLLTAGVIVFAFLGDMLSSLYKRKFKVKDFNNLIPGHGGFLDRFDSLIAGGAWVAFFERVTGF